MALLEACKSRCSIKVTSVGLLRFESPLKFHSIAKNNQRRPFEGSGPEPELGSRNDKIGFRSRVAADSVLRRDGHGLQACDLPISPQSVQ
jgi:hypothetical protein